ncbi:hypothetical protein Glove_71g44 [Diversispora epigaea]|uniref:Serine-threonine/tyrosine-protein kinase catalytic domain-containing protein n=1 Tax=Diversispora epigaea TaxID=1348612 RepID=A0A397JKL9_9GLOM|nr:hypothetical protein Glove_71g44 [Diversispora epigaea]
MSYGKCPECNQKNTYYNWCKPCNSKHFQNDFNNWTSGNDKIDKFIQDAQLNANGNWDVIEWIPYDRFKDVKQIGKGGFGTIHYASARWINGCIDKWDIENQHWKRDRKYSEEVALKKFDNFVNFNDVLNEMEIHFKIYTDSDVATSIRFHHHLIPLEQYMDGSLDELYLIDEYSSTLKIKAADVYSFGIIAYEMITGFPPYPDIPHDEDLAIKICNGLRPKIPFHISKLITRMIMRCWDARVKHRPTFKELKDELWKYYLNYRNYLRYDINKDSEIGIQIKKAEEFSANQEPTNTTTTTTTTPLNYQTHPQAIYTSRLLNYSKLPKPKNEENFERELEELTKSFSHINTNDDIDEF